MTAAQNYNLTIVFPRENHLLHTNREFLAAESPIFYKMIYENPSIPKTHIVVSDVSSKLVHHALECLTTEGASLASARLSLLLRTFARDYQIKKLFILCGKFLVRQLTVYNVEVIHDLACHCLDKSMQFFCWLKFDISWREIFSNRSFYQCSESTIRRLVSRPIYRDMDEFFLWNALYTWGLTKMLRENSIENPILHRKILEEFLPHIRFLIMKSAELNAVFNSNILTKDECSAIKVAYESRNVNILPPSICRSTLTRSSENLPHYVTHIYSHFCPKHTELRFVKANDHFYSEFVTSHDCFLLGVALPLVGLPNAVPVPIAGEMQVTVTNPLTNKREQNTPWRFTTDYQCIKLHSPILIDKNCTVCINVSIAESNYFWKIDHLANCDIGYLGKDVCESADVWQSFYIKEPMLYF